MNDRIHIPDRFKKIIYLHMVKNLLTNISMRAPLILGIHGPSGYGKTYQCEHILSSIGVKSFLISGGQLESGTAGEPAELVRDIYVSASRSIQDGECSVAVIIINDIDTGLGNWGEKVQTTINTQTIYGELMHIVDYPTSVKGKITKRIPIIVTGNDFTKLYQPMVRAGRMTAFEWIPTIQEKSEIVSGIFPELNIEECDRLVSEFSNQPIAFFSHLRSTLIDEVLWTEIREIGISGVIDNLNKGIEPEVYIPIQYAYLAEASRQLSNSGQITNHLKEG